MYSRVHISVPVCSVTMIKQVPEKRNRENNKNNSHMKYPLKPLFEDLDLSQFLLSNLYRNPVFFLQGPYSLHLK
uniref:Putative leucine-rich repeat receptor-like serine/threonine-protein kinase At5g15730 isoform X2 n=1 Tax=Rhizophora mucronata TaxID=61149 RepID=A0A2P2MWJ3_RHIMU